MVIFPDPRGGRERPPPSPIPTQRGKHPQSRTQIICSSLQYWTQIGADKESTSRDHRVGTTRSSQDLHALVCALPVPLPRATSAVLTEVCTLPSAILLNWFYTTKHHLPTLSLASSRRRPATQTSSTWITRYYQHVSTAAALRRSSKLVRLNTTR